MFPLLQLSGPRVTLSLLFPVTAQAAPAHWGPRVRRGMVQGQIVSEASDNFESP